LNESDLSGQIVVSKCGRDSGRNLIVIGFFQEDIVLVSDGRLRKAEKPKKKKMKHLFFTGHYADEIRALLLSGQTVTNGQIKNALSKVKEVIDENNSRLLDYNC